MWQVVFKHKNRGFSLIEVIIVSALLALVFAGLFAGFEYSLKLVAHTRAKMTALSLATDRSEYIRSLPYASIGTIAGIPNGAIPQNRTVSLNGITFNERVLIEYVDDPADGLAGADSNGVIADYKRFKIEYTWTIYGSTESFSLLSTASPVSIETNAGGGTVRVNVFDASVAPLPGIDVRLRNTTGTTTVDVTRVSDANGTVLFTGAPASGGYEVFVSAPGYSSAQTYQATTTLAFPSMQPVAVVEAGVSTINFFVDRVSDVTVRVFDSETVVTHDETFADVLGLSASSSVSATSGALVLAETGGVYAGTGLAMLDPITPGANDGWGIVHIKKIEPLDTEVRVRVYASTSTVSLIDEALIPGNAAGFIGSYINLTALDPVAYPTVVVGIELRTTNTAVTPQVDEVEVVYSDVRSWLANTNFTFRGEKIIGQDASAQNVYKYMVSTTTNASGERFFNDIEWDTYRLDLGDGYTVAEACEKLPYPLDPNETAVLYIKAALGGLNNMRVLAKDSSGQPVIGATVELDDMAGTVRTRETGWCGQAFFESVPSGVGYDLRVGALGFATTTMASTTVSGVVYQEVVLNP